MEPSPAPGASITPPVGVRRIVAVAEISSHAEVRAAAKDWSTFSSVVQGDPDVRDYPQLPLEMDPPGHGLYRAILEPILGRRAVMSMEPAIGETARALIAEFARRGRIEAVHELAVPMVATTIAGILGRPQDAGELTSWGISSWEAFPDGTRSGARLDRYVARALDESLDDTDGAFGQFTHARIGRRPLSRIEQVGLANLVLAGGRDTVILILCGAMWHLAADPAARAWLKADPGRLQLAIEEYLRFFSPNPGMERRVTRDVEGSWGRAAAGEAVVLGWGPANHDRAAFERPEALRLDRRPNPHLAFGSGPHTCVGIHLARLEARVFLEHLLAAVPDWRIGDGIEIEWTRLANDVVPARFDSLPLEAVSDGSGMSGAMPR